ncbi:hypothetical protein C7Y66_10935 [Chroococcidiopsis sp. CCALA 051]|uniref:hypothetical protein n=1 Tax=Chroococcidiopsis sp. CCALA 051 TaxID=869949 RepID=UPI000D0D4054|nr:hypothetical protein [Chroococcidiopsis sp. CCALA 051]MBE9015828.1 hypothetical protein [Chroococcidiopsidales cyanobacterium LEGE 13417]PSM49128.1 hypothetical protein C7Y66_10935 [Chroococcidiopsis sp. CCALA 051]
MSKFKSILSAAKNREPEPEPEEFSQDAVVNQPQPVVESQPTQKRGRPKGKRSHPDYEQVTAYIRKETHRDIKIALLSEGDGREFSELIQELLEQWLVSRT